MTNVVASDIEKELAQIDNLPTLPDVITKLGSAVHDPQSDANGIAAIIEDDQAMMARILKVVNSSFYAGAEPITSVQQAVARMGLQAVNNIAMSTAVFSTFSGGTCTTFDPREFWRHSISSGIAVVVLYEQARPFLRKQFGSDLLRLAGLMHDVGKIVLVQHFPDAFLAAVATAREQRRPLFEVEREHYGTDHAEVGAWLGEKWSLAPELVSAIRWHHAPSECQDEHTDLVKLVHSANYMCNLQRLGDSGDCSSPSFVQKVWKELGLTIGHIAALVDEIVRESEKSEILLSFV